MTRRESAAHSLPGAFGARRGDDGASAVEYGLVLAAVTAVVTAVVFGFGGFVHDTFEETTTCLSKQGAAQPFPDC